MGFGRISKTHFEAGWIVSVIARLSEEGIIQYILVYIHTYIVTYVGAFMIGWQTGRSALTIGYI